MAPPIMMTVIDKIREKKSIAINAGQNLAIFPLALNALPVKIKAT